MMTAAAQEVNGNKNVVLMLISTTTIPTIPDVSIPCLDVVIAIEPAGRPLSDSRRGAQRVPLTTTEMSCMALVSLQRSPLPRSKGGGRCS